MKLDLYGVGSSFSEALFSRINRKINYADIGLRRTQASQAGHKLLRQSRGGLRDHLYQHCMTRFGIPHDRRRTKPQPQGSR